MAKALFYRLFGIGKMPAALSAELTAEGLQFSDEGLKSSVTYGNFKMPDRFETPLAQQIVVRLHAISAAERSCA